jgi:hypothetical protein
LSSKHEGDHAARERVSGCRQQARDPWEESTPPKVESPVRIRFE